jgi:hypothetical protein
MALLRMRRLRQQLDEPRRSACLRWSGALSRCRTAAMWRSAAASLCLLLIEIVVAHHAHMQTLCDRPGKALFVQLCGIDTRPSTLRRSQQHAQQAAGRRRVVRSRRGPRWLQCVRLLALLRQRCIASHRRASIICHFQKVSCTASTARCYALRAPTFALGGIMILGRCAAGRCPGGRAGAHPPASLRRHDRSRHPLQSQRPSNTAEARGMEASGIGAQCNRVT